MPGMIDRLIIEHDLLDIVAGAMIREIGPGKFSKLCQPELIPRVLSDDTVQRISTAAGEVFCSSCSCGTCHLRD